MGSRPLARLAWNQRQFLVQDLAQLLNGQVAGSSATVDKKGRRALHSQRLRLGQLCVD